MSATSKTFKAKDIQEIVGITKSRYDYLVMRIGITPGVEQAEGTGRSNIYSYKNLLQFAFAHTANNLGLPPKSTRVMLVFLDTVSSWHSLNLLNLYCIKNYLSYYKFALSP